MTHKTAFPEISVPEEIQRMVSVGTLIDVSWKNDAAPSFIRQWDRDRWFDQGDVNLPRLWVYEDGTLDVADGACQLYRGRNMQYAIGVLMLEGWVKRPRFVLAVGAYQEAYSDMPAGLPVGIYDRKARIMALQFHPKYDQLICLEKVGDHGPEALTKWLNSLSESDLKSEGIE